MNHDEEHNPQDQELWRRMRRPQGQPASPVDPNDLAAYLDGKAEDAVVERIEQQMQSDSRLFEEVMELRQMSQESQRQVTPRMLANAVALVQDQEQEHEQPAVLGRIGWDLVSAAHRWRVGLRWAAAAAVVMITCVTGFALGQGTHDQEDLAELRSNPPKVLDMAGSPSDPLLPFNGANGEQEGGQ